MLGSATTGPSTSWHTNASHITLAELEVPIAVTSEDEGVGVAWVTLFTLVFVLLTVATLGGNLLVCLAVILVRKLRQPSNYLLISLAVSDFFVGCFVMPFAYVYLITGSWKFGPTVCAFWTSADVSLCTASILNLCAISVDKYAAITRPLSYQRTPRKIFGMIVAVWIGSLLISAIPLIAFQKTSANVVALGTCRVSQNLFYQIYATMGSFYIPTLVMLIVNFKIFLAARRLSLADSDACSQMVRSSDSERHSYTSVQTGRLARSVTEDDSNGGPESHSGKSKRIELPLLRKMRSAIHFEKSGRESWFNREGKAVKTLGIIMGAFITCWLPFFTLALVKPLCGRACLTPPWADWLVLWLGYFNSTLNPMIYAKYNRDFRMPFREMLCCRFGTLQSVLRTEAFAERFGPPEAREEEPRKVLTPAPLRHPLEVLADANLTHSTHL